MRIQKIDRAALPPEKSYALDAVHTVYEPQGELVYPLSRGSGPAARPLDGVGEAVLVGQKLSECADNPALGVHSACSGTVTAIERRQTARGERLCLVVDNDKMFRPVSDAAETDWLELSRGEILARIRANGVLGLNVDRFPTAGQLDALAPDDVAHVAVDGSEWEPIISSDDDILRTCSHPVVTGLRILLRLFPGAGASLLIGDDKSRAIEYISQASGSAGGIRVVAVPAGRPLGDERMIARALTAREKSARRARCLVVTCAEAAAICAAVCRGEPWFRRIVTVAGPAVKNPGNYMVRVGTSCAELLSAAGGLRPGAVIQKAVLGGPITGLGLSDLDVPVEKDTGALLLFDEDAEAQARKTETECIRCGRCARACPAGLLPMQLLRAAEKGDLAEFRRLHGEKCIHCGVCTWICPARQPLAERLAYTGALAGRE